MQTQIMNVDNAVCIPNVHHPQFIGRYWQLHTCKYEWEGRPAHNADLMLNNATVMRYITAYVTVQRSDIMPNVRAFYRFNSGEVQTY